jgi:rare lipoprotein A
MSPKFASFRLAALAAVLLALSGCTGANPVSRITQNWSAPPPAQQGSYKVGNPYQVGSVSYTPRESFDLVETGIASWYGPDFHGGKTANGEIYNQNELTAAHRTLQMPSFVRVTNLENGRSVVVRINDRGPYLHGRIIDLSKRGAELLGFANKGTARVRLEVLGRESRQIAEAAKRGENTSRMTLAEAQRLPEAPEASAPPVRLASLQTDTSSDTMPESLQTPTITVEDLSAPGKPGETKPPAWSATQKSLPGVVAQPPGPRPQQTASAAIPVHVDQGRLMPDPVVTTEPVKATGIFVQAGSFAVYENAERLSRKLEKIGHAAIDPVTVNGRKLYRVKLGPLPSVTAADNALEQIIRAGSGGARVIRN